MKDRPTSLLSQQTPRRQEPKCKMFGTEEAPRDELSGVEPLGRQVRTQPAKASTPRAKILPLPLGVLGVLAVSSLVRSILRHFRARAPDVVEGNRAGGG